MKTVKIQGGFGNQLFCLALAHSLSLVGGEGAHIDIAAFASDPYGRAFALADLARTLGLGLVRRPWMAHRLTGALARRLPLPFQVREGPPPRGRRDLERLAARGGYFDGYWQDERWIADPARFIAAVRDFVIARTGDQPRHELVIHYRSYKEERRPERRTTPPPDFHERALAAVEGRLGRVDKIALVSDDLDLALARLGPLSSRAQPVRGGDAFSDLALMMNARSLILGNSSFSWWGGFCGEAEMVIYPAREGLFHYPAPAARFDVV
ncbi:MAG: O-fucosyltransferase family protein [Caulobacteraceae bacterium]